MKKNPIKNDSVAQSEVMSTTSPEAVRQARYQAERELELKCTAFREAKLHAIFDPNDAGTWDNAFPSRENWTHRMKAFEQALQEDWVVYTSDKFGFTFEYPKSWTVLASNDGTQLIVKRSGTQIELPLVIRVVEFERAPKQYDEELYSKQSFFETLYTQNELLEKKKQIEDGSQHEDKNGKRVAENTDYSTFEYHNFYRHAEFFIDNTMITVVQPLSVIVPDINGHQFELLSKVQMNQGGELALRETNFTNRLVESFRAIPPFNESRDFDDEYR